MASKTSELYDLVKDEIVKSKFGSDEIINEKDIAERYSVSKTPVREALAMLVQEGYLRKIPRIGYIVRQLTDDEYAKLIYLRYTLELGVVMYIIKNCSVDEIDTLNKYCQDKNVSYKDFSETNLNFHFAMAALTKNEYLISSVRNAFERMIRVPSPTIYAEIHSEPHKMHLKLIDALKNRDVAETTKLIRNECRRDDDKDMDF